MALTTLTYSSLLRGIPWPHQCPIWLRVGWLQQAHAADERYTVRDGINIGRFAIKLKSLATERSHETAALETAVIETLGEEALRYARRTKPIVS